MGNNDNENVKNKSRRKSNISNCVCLFIGLFTIIGDVIFIYNNYSDDLKGWKSSLLKISPYIIFWAIVIVVISVLLIKSVNDLNEQLEKNKFPYSFDYVKELAVYKAVGSSKSKIKCDGIEIDIYSNYLDWKNHITKEYRKKDCIIQHDFENFYRFLIKRKRSAGSRKEMLYGILLPVELGVIAVCCGSDGIFDGPITCAIGVVVGSCIFMWQAMKEQFNNEDEIHFINDLLEILNSNYDDILSDEEASLVKNIIDLKRRANQAIMQKGNEIPLTAELFYFMAAVDKSIKLIDVFLYALEKRNITVLAILTRVQMDCVFRTYALQLVDDKDKFCKEILDEKKQLNHIKDKNGNKMSDSYLAKEVGKWINRPVDDLYKKVCGFVHFSDSNLHTMIHSIDDNRFKMTSFTENNPKENKEVFDKVSMELGEQFYFFGSILTDELFDTWVKQCL